MQKNGNDILFSASDLVHFLECEHLSALDKIDLDTPLPRTADDDGALVFQARGFEHESSYLSQLSNTGMSIKDLSEVRGSPYTKAAATVEAMKTGVETIFQATLLSDNLFGHPDFLRRAKTPSRFGTFSYEVVDTKLARHPKASFIIQLCFYSELLSELQGLRPRSMHIVLGDGSELNFRFDQYREYYHTLKDRFLDRMSRDGIDNPYPETCEHCSLCHWRGLCEAKWIADDHLNQVANVTKIQIKKLRGIGIRTLEQLAQHDESISVPKMTSETLIKLHHQASLQLYKRINKQDKYEILDLDTEERRGFYRIPRPDPGDMFFDMEGDPLESEGLEYLFGIFYHDNNAAEFKYFLAHNRDEERKAFENFMDFVTQRLKRYPSAHIYHYASYEETALKRLMCLHGTRESQVDDLLRNRKLVDLYKVVRESIRISEPKYSIKNVETFYSEKREGQVTNAMASLVFYEKWLVTKDQEILDQIVEYNQEDCRSNYLLREWLLTLRPSELKWMNEDDGTSQISTPVKSQRRQNIEEKLAVYRSKLVDNESISPSDRPLYELVFYLLDFHRRAEKPQWWALFSRRDMNPEELSDDPECVGDMTLIGSPSSSASMNWCYRYPDQEFKLQEGEECVRTDTSEKIGKIARIDEDNQLIWLDPEDGGALPAKLSISKGRPIPTSRLTRAIYDFADSLIRGDKRYSTLEAILRRSTPSIQGLSPGDSIVNPRQTDISEIIEAVANLKQSYLFIQGPPGAGKTYTGSRVIAELLKRGFRVGVSSNSHKAINNLLKHIELRAEETGLQFSGLKKSTEDKGSQFNGKFIKDVLDNKSIYNSKTDLVAGTAWLFAGMDQVLDFLFVDEAGQVSLANLVAMGISARNIVLLGDQMQLGQPIQGVHPGRSGESTLEYLLDGAATISADKGVFLETTWRMHQDVCRFISEAVYDSRLQPQELNQNQRLILNEDAHECLKPTGICFVPIDHDGCSQRSEEEAGLIKTVLESLLEQDYQDRNGKKHPMSLENIMVVAPYNMQVNLLKRILPKGARVGTVDKFQGQEAEVVIISMTTSSGEYLPRYIEFLYSKNRLNVAISRARTLAVLVVNPSLLSIKCNTIEQIELVNTLCWAKHYAEQSHHITSMGVW